LNLVVHVPRRINIEANLQKLSLVAYAGRGNRAVIVITVSAAIARSALSCVAARQVYISSGNG